MKKEIYNSYKAIKPDTAAKERMLANILASASGMQDMRKEIPSEDASMPFDKGTDTNIKKWKKTHKLQLAASLALVLIIPTAAAYATNLFGLRNLSMGKITVEEPLTEAPVREVEIISLQGVSDSPEAKACKEWTKFYFEDYDKDGSILSEIGNGPTDIDAKYTEVYNCYTQEMADKVDEICQKYQLSLLTGVAIGNYENVCAQTGIGDVCGGQSEGVQHTVDGGYFYDDGTLHLEGSATINRGVSCVADYQFLRSVKGTFCPYFLNIEDADDYEQWEYTAAGGETMLLALSDFKALIIVEKEESYVIVNILGNILADTFDINRESLEALADSFDLSAIS